MLSATENVRHRALQIKPNTQGLRSYTTIHSTGAMTELSLTWISQGDLIPQRKGNRIRPKYLQLQLRFQNLETSGRAMSGYFTVGQFENSVSYPGIWQTIWNPSLFDSYWPCPVGYPARDQYDQIVEGCFVVEPLGTGRSRSRYCAWFDLSNCSDIVFENATHRTAELGDIRFSYRCDDPLETPPLVAEATVYATLYYEDS